MANFMDTLKELSSAQDLKNNNTSSSIQSAPPPAAGNNLPYSQIPNLRPGQIKRNIITWFIPEYGIVRMYINPQNMVYNHKKLINKDRTKGGYTLQYWGNELTTINLAGTTGSSGIEGINVLYEMYMAEQSAFDGVALTNAAAEYAAKGVQWLGGLAGSGVNTLFGGGSESNAAAQSIGSGVLGGLMGMDSPSSPLASRNIMSLAQLAFGVEMYYNGWVYRGFFDNMTVTEKANDFMIDYQITFVVTQKRGYRVNNFPWSRSPNGPSQDSFNNYSYNLNKITI